jgi:hypothetical protein
MPETKTIVRDEFSTHNLNAEGIARCQQVREKFSELLDFIEGRVSAPSRVRSLAVTKLEEACTFTIKAIANVPENQA